MKQILTITLAAMFVTTVAARCYSQSDCPEGMHCDRLSHQCYGDLADFVPQCSCDDDCLPRMYCDEIYNLCLPRSGGPRRLAYQGGCSDECPDAYHRVNDQCISFM
ncbi:hypothetical protein BGZ92_003904 [Podila epicladia]|nr:hypothetical protein BGZ92_003904 [Podila epicladia]